MNKKFLYISAFLFVILCVLSVSLGSVNIFSLDYKVREILISNRISRIVTASLVGIAIPLSGMLMQNLFKNPLAGPYVLGISSGSGLFVAILVMTTGIIGVVNISQYSIALASVLGAFLSMIVIMTISHKTNDSNTILIVGILYASFASSLISIVEFYSPSNKLKSFFGWLFGSLESLDFGQIIFFSTINIICITLIFIKSNAFNALTLGENQAKILGISVKETRFMIISIASILTGISIAFVGPIAFVGIVIPHIVRSILKTSDHRKLTFGNILVGVISMIFLDLISRLPIFETSIPINIATSLFGAPIIMFIILKKI